VTVATIQPIETVCFGYRFRSRLEARWSVFFAAAGIRFEYEPEGFSTRDGNYLPDFGLPQLRALVEVKPTREAAEAAKPRLQAPVAAGIGDRGILISGPPNTFEPPHISGVDRHGHWWEPAEWLQCPFCDQVSIAIPHAPRCVSCGDHPGRRILHWPSMRSPRVTYAMEAGQQARFEHGEDPTPEPYVAAATTRPCRVYMAGAVIEEKEVRYDGAAAARLPHVLPWRWEIFGLGPENHLRADSSAVGRFHYAGPTILCDHGIGKHGLASRCLRELAAADTLFGWIDRTDTVGTLAEIGAAHSWHKPRFLAFANETLASHFYFARQLAHGAVVTPSVTEAWKLFVRWRDREEAPQ
jgi:hypothetical protein